MLCHERIMAASVSVIRRLHPWMSSMDGIHGWHFHPWMTFLHPWMTSMDGISPSMDDTSPSMDDISPSMDDISPSIDDIHRWHFSIHGWHLSIHGWHFSIHGWHPRMTFLQPLIHMPCYSPQLAFQNYYNNWRGILIWKIWCIQFSPKIIQMKMPSMDGEMSSVDVVHGWRNVIHGWRVPSMDGEMSSVDESVIVGCHSWITHGWRQRMMDMDGA